MNTSVHNRLIDQCAHSKALSEECELCDQIMRIEDSIRMGHGDRPLPQKQINIYFDEVALPIKDEAPLKAQTIWIQAEGIWYKVRATDNVQELIDMILKVLDTERLSTE